MTERRHAVVRGFVLIAAGFGSLASLSGPAPAAHEGGSVGCC